MSMQVGSGKFFDAQTIPVGGGTIHSTPVNISGKDQVTFKLSSTLACTAKVFYADGDPTNANTIWYPSPTAGIASIALTANTPVSFQERINAGWARIDIPQQGGVAPVVTASIETKAEQ